MGRIPNIFVCGMKFLSISKAKRNPNGIYNYLGDIFFQLELSEGCQRAGERSYESESESKSESLLSSRPCPSTLA